MKRYISYFISLFLIFLIYDVLQDGIIITFSLGASGFILLIKPIRKCLEKEKCAKTKIKFLKCNEICLYDIRNSLYGYVLGGLFGTAFSILNTVIHINFSGFSIDFAGAAITAAATVLTAFFMYKLNTPHPPAAAFAFGLAAVREDVFNAPFALSLILSVAAALFFVIMMCVIRYMFDKRAL